MLGGKLWRALGSGIKGIEAKVSALKHASRKGRHDRCCLYMQVAEHGVGAPATNETDEIRIDPCTEECHGTTGTEGAGFDVIRAKPIVATMCRDKAPEVASDGAGMQGCGAAPYSVVDVQWGVRRCAISAKVLDASCNGAHRAEIGVAAGRMPNLFSPNAILLCGEHENNESGDGEIRQRGGRDIEACCSTVELDVP